MRRLAREAGLMVGISAGAALAATQARTHTLTSGVVVTVFFLTALKISDRAFWTAE